MQDTKPDWPETHFNAAKRTHIESGQLTDWFVGYGKDRSCQFEGSWHHMIRMAALILSSENTQIAVEQGGMPDSLYQPELRDVAEEIDTYTESAYEFEDLDL